MKPRVLLERVTTPAGELTLHRHDRDYLIQIDRLDLMSSRQHGSEERLAELAVAAAAGRGPWGAGTPLQVLVGGLGMGYTLRAALDAVESRRGSSVSVAEVFPAVVEWNRDHLGALADHPLEDSRTIVRVEDVQQSIADPAIQWNVVLLDVDNGPSALTLDSNESLYSPLGLKRIREGLAPEGVLAVWSSHRDAGFVKRLNKAGFLTDVHSVRARKGAGSQHVVFIAQVR